MALAPTAGDRLDEFREALGEWLSTKSFHGPEKVVQALAYVACPISWNDLDEVTGLSVAQDLTKITDDRHAIVHEGKKPYIRRDLAEQANSLMAAIARHIDGEVCSCTRGFGTTSGVPYG